MHVIVKYAGRGLNILRGSVIILACYYAGKYLSGFLHHVLSGSVIGMLLLFFLLCTGLVKKEHVSAVSEFLLANLVLFFIPALVAVTLIDFSPIWPSMPHILIIAVLSTFLVMGVTGLFVQWREKKGIKPNEE